MAGQTETLHVGGQQIPLLRQGSGTPVLYLHGILGDLYSEPLDEVPPFHKMLAQRFQLLAPAHPGFAEAAGALERVDDIEDLVFHYRDVLRTLGLERVHLVGHCLGGWVAAELAARCPHFVDHLVLIGAAGISLPEHRIGDLFYAMAPRADSTRQLVRDLLFEDPGSELAMKLVPDEVGQEERQRLIYRASVAAARVGWSPPYLHSMKLPRRLHHIAVPTLVVWGERDQLVPVQNGQVYASNIPGARLATIPSGAHSLVAERPHELAEAVMGFLAGE